MPEPWQIWIYERQQLVFSGDFDGPVELGRQGEGDEAVYARKREGDHWRLVIAGRDEDTVSRKHAKIEVIDSGKVRVANLSAKVPIRLPDGGDIRPGTASALDLPTLLLLGKKTVRIQGMIDEEGVECLREATVPPGSIVARPEGLPTLGLSGSVGSQDVESLVRWLRSTLDVFQSATTSVEFFHKAAQAVVENVGLDSGRALMLKDGQWAAEVLKTAPSVAADDLAPASRYVLGKVLGERRTFWQSPGTGSTSDVASLAAIGAVVAAPILNRQGDVIGALYGDRRPRRGFGPTPRATKVEAMLVELLASGVAAGLERLDREQAAVSAQVRFEQFFTPELAHVLAERPEMLKGQDAEITVLFCDIRGFSRIAEKLGPARVVEWIGDVMGALSDCVRDYRGVLVDYIGDELMAMWGAPEEQPDHAVLACQAARDMLAQVPVLNERWLPVLGEEMDLGIGLNTGMARVGNTGSRHKFKYGPLGNTVNLASRVQGLTKYLKTRLLVTEATRARLGADIPMRRIGQARVVNIAEPVALYELPAASSPQWDDLRRGYESALARFEDRDFRSATRILGGLLPEHPDDGASLVLLSRVVNCLVEPECFDPVFRPPGK